MTERRPIRHHLILRNTEGVLVRRTTALIEDTSGQPAGVTLAPDVVVCAPARPESDEVGR